MYKRVDFYLSKFYDFAETIKKRLIYPALSYELKVEHTGYVLKNTEDIIKSIDLDKDIRECILLSALFHDIGRFIQYADYGTFCDHESVDHGELGFEILNDFNILTDNLTSDEKKIITGTVKYHNKQFLPDNISDEMLISLKVVRDADKVDILRIVSEEYKKSKQDNVVMLNLSDDSGISDSVYNKIISRQSVKYSELFTRDDFKALQLGWVYDINYRPALDIILKKSYLDVIFDSMNKDFKSIDLYEKVSLFLNEKLEFKNR